MRFVFLVLAQNTFTVNHTPPQPFLYYSLVSFDHVPQGEISPRFIMRNRTFRFFYVLPSKPMLQLDSAAMMATRNNNHLT